MSEFNFDLLAFGAHPDDVELTCGGTIKKLANLGHKIALVDLTQGELGSRGDVATRQAESKAAGAILGVAYRENLSLPDGAIDGDASGEPGNDNSQLSKIVSALRRLRPQIVFVNYGKCRHPDHEATSKLVTRALFFSGLPKYRVAGAAPEDDKPFAPRKLIYYSSRVEFKPSFIVDISEVVEEKEKARRAYASQLGLDSKEGHNTLLTSPLMLPSMDSRDRYYGSMIGVSHGEPFLIRSTLSIDDPIDFFRKVKPDSAMVFPRE